ncbi:mandelate racemase/muconate lactonizing enzyme family protein [Alicyclobacillaceae bacterium I2511]|nr:mandelate racemase/muconate lactonizing enzyme family protein [Alicyclobacillaceae bacterium I2511]
MKITNVRTAVVEANFDWTLVRVETDFGLTGLGEAFFAPGLTATIHSLGEFLKGKDPLQVEPLVRNMFAAASAAGGAGQVFHAVTGIETALWDILGQHLGAPLWKLWGGKYRDKVRIYADCHGGDALESLDALLQPRHPDWDQSHSQWNPSAGSHSERILEEYSPKAYADKAQRMAEQGFTILKFDLDVPNPYTVDGYNRSLGRQEIEYLAGLMAAVREAVGPKVELAADCHWKFAPDDSIHLAEALQPYRLLWLEDPIPPDNMDALKFVRDHSPVPILSGENLYGRQGFRQMIEQQAVAIVAPDLQKVGGLSEGLRIAELADLYYMPIAPHNISSPVGTLASVHACACMPNFLALEWHASEVPFWGEMLTEGSLIKNGSIEVPNRPGLGATLNEEVVRRYAKSGEPVFA